MYNFQGLTVSDYKFYRAIDVNESGLWREVRYVNNRKVYQDSGDNAAPIFTDEWDCYPMQSGQGDEYETVYVYEQSVNWSQRKPDLKLYQHLDDFDHISYWKGI